MVPPVSSPLSSPVIYNTLLPNGIVGTLYTAYLVALEGKPLYTWSIISGALPLAFPSILAQALSRHADLGRHIEFHRSGQGLGRQNGLEGPPDCRLGPVHRFHPEPPRGHCDRRHHCRLHVHNRRGDGFAGPSGRIPPGMGAGPVFQLVVFSGHRTYVQCYGTYQLRAQARCQTNPTTTSSWSAAKQVTIYSAVSTIQGSVTYNGSPVTNWQDAQGFRLFLSFPMPTTTTRHSRARQPIIPARVPISIPNIPEGLYNPIRSN